MRLALLGIHHETNTFSSKLADRARYEAGGIRRGDQLRARYEDSSATFAGYFETSPNEDDVELVPLMDSMVNPSGPIAADIYQEMAAEMLGLLESEGPFDGVLLGLHGAGVAIGEPSVDADLAERVRAVVGSDVPIGANIDMHANVEQRLVDAVDILAAYQTNPHVDPAIRARFVKDHVIAMVRGGARPAMALVALPLVVNITAQDTSTAPMSEILEIARSKASRAGAVDVSVLEGFPYADVPHMGMSVLAVHTDPAVASSLAREIAAEVWDRREPLQGDSISVADAIREIAAHDGDKPILVLDVGDNIGGGGPGDSTVLLKAVIDGGIHDIASTVYDPLVVAELAAVEPGTTVTVTVGGRSAEQDGDPVTMTAELVGRHTGLFEASGMAHGGFRFFDGGEMVSLRGERGIAVVLTSKPVQTVTPAQLEVVGLEPSSFRAIVGKGVNAPRAGYSNVCGRYLTVDTPGVTRASVEAFDYKFRRRPMYPYELEFELTD